MAGALALFADAFPIVIIDENFEGKDAAGRAVRQLASALGEEGFRVVTGVGYQDARRLARIYHNESSLLISVDGLEANGQWAALEDLLTVTRRRNTRLPIFLLGDERNVESVPTDLLKYTQAFFRLHAESPEYLARAIGRSARLYLDNLLPPMFRALTKYVLRGSDAWPPSGHGGGVGFRRSPVGRVFYEFFGENMVRADMSAPVPELGSPIAQTGAVAEAQRNAARVFGSDHTRFIADGAAAANRIVWQALVGRGDPVLCDRNCDPSILHALILTGATPIYLLPSRNSLGLVGPVSRDQLTPQSIQQKLAARGLAESADVRIRLMTLTNSTRDGVCYNVDAIKNGLGDAVDVLHFDERWLAHASFHEFYAGHHAMSSTTTPPRRARRALTCATQSTHLALAALAPAAMLHLLDSTSQHVDLTRFDVACEMHTTRSPQYTVLASCDVATAMMEQPGGHAIVEETIGEALAFRRAVAAVKRTSGGPWWFTLWQSPALAEYPVADPLRWRLNPADRWHGFGTTMPEDVLLDPTKVTLLTPGHRPEDKGLPHGIPAAVVVAVLKSRRIEVQRSGAFSLLVPVSIGIPEGRWSTIITELLNFRDAYERNTPVRDILPQLANDHPHAYGTIGLKELCARVHASYGRLCPSHPQGDVYATLPEMAMSPADAHDHVVRGCVEPVELDQLMNRTVAVPIVAHPPGVSLLMPGERITRDTVALQSYLVRARQFDSECPGFEQAISGIRVEPGAGSRYVVDCVKE